MHAGPPSPAGSAARFKFAPLHQERRSVFTSGPSVTKSIRVLIVENHQVVADSLAALLSGEPDMTVVGAADTVAESLSRTLESQPDVIVMDYHLGDGTGAQAASMIRRARPGIRLIFLSREDTDAAHVVAVEAGASAFIHKSEAAAKLIDAIRMVDSGVSLIGPGTVAKILSRRRDLEALRTSLTAREREVLRLVAAGLPSRDIAAQLRISYTTVRTHIRALTGKLEAHSKLEAIAKARELTLID